MATPQEEATRRVRRRVDGPVQDFSRQVRGRLERSTRTAQACDRCKIRKIKCDGKPNGCQACRQNGFACRTVDRVSGRATSRGHQDRIEQENRLLRQKCEEFMQQLRTLGLHVSDIDLGSTYIGGAPLTHPPQAWATPVASWSGPSQTTQLPSLSNSTSTLFSQALPTYRNGAPGDNYLGVSSTSSELSQIPGTSMHFFGIRIDVADFAPDDVENISSPTSYEYFIATILKQNPNNLHEIEPALPTSESNMRMFADLYFRSLNPYMPILHRPTFMAVVARMYNDLEHTPTPAEKVMVHMVLAQMKYQIGLRNADKVSIANSTHHWTWSLGQYYEMHTHHRLEDVQAMALVAIHLRNFSKPAAALSMVRKVLDMALELGLHRSAKAWTEESILDHTQLEARKRVFWTVSTLHTHISGKLGRPMPLRVEDIDVEFPEPVNDNLADEPPNCSIRVGIACVKISALLGQMYSTIYSVRRDPLMHESLVRRFSELLTEWKDELPEELQSPNHHTDERQVYALYVQFWEAEFALLLHHPAICLSTDTEWVTNDANICLTAAENMLRVVDQLRRLKSLDFPWINVTVYLAALFTTLYVQANMTDSISPAEMKRLRNDMDTWLEIMGDIGDKLGSGSRLRDKISPIVDNSLQKIAQRLSDSRGKQRQVDQSAALVAAAIATEANRVSQEQQQAHERSEGLTSGFNNATSAYANSSSNDLNVQRHDSFSQATNVGQSTSFRSAAQATYNYPDPSLAPTINSTYDSTNATNTAGRAYSAPQGYVPAVASEQSAHVGEQAAAGAVAAQQPSDQAEGPPGFTIHPAHGQALQQQIELARQREAAATANAALYSLSGFQGGQHPQHDWLKWAHGLSIGPGQDYLSGANTLMTLRGTDAVTTATTNNATNQQLPQQEQWPYMLFNRQSEPSTNEGREENSISGV